MSRKTNKHGLQRYIPEASKQKIRELCGFGCVICGSIPYDYDHFETEFHDCKDHDVNDIVLLCDKHHREKDSLGTHIIKKYLSKNPPSDRNVLFDPTILTEDFEIIWPSVNLKSRQNNIVIDGEEVLSILPSGDPKNPLHLNGVFFDDRGVKICEVFQNEFRLPPNELGDFQCTKFRFKVISKSGIPILKFRMEPQALIIEELFFVKNNSFIFGNQEAFLVGTGDSYGDFSNANIINNLTGITLNSGNTPLKWQDDKLMLPFLSMSLGGATIGSNGGSGIHWG